MPPLSTWANLAEIFGALTIVIGVLFALVQLRQFRRERREAAAYEIVHSFQDHEFVRAWTRLKHLPPDVDWEAERARDPTIERDAVSLVMVFESLGLLVHQGVVPLEAVDGLMGGMVRNSWVRLRTYATVRRRESGTGKPLEWTQWLAERLDERGRERPEILEGAHVLYKDWKP